MPEEKTKKGKRNISKKRLLKTLILMGIAVFMICLWMPIGIHAEYNGGPVYQGDEINEDALSAEYYCAIPLVHYSAKEIKADPDGVDRSGLIRVDGKLYHGYAKVDFIKIDKIAMKYNTKVYEGDKYDAVNVSGEVIYEDETTRTIETFEALDVPELLSEDTNLKIKTDYGTGKLFIDVIRVKGIKTIPKVIKAGDEAKQEDISSIILTYEDDTEVDVTEDIENIELPDSYAAGENKISFTYHGIKYNSSVMTQMYTNSFGLKLYDSADTDSEQIISLPFGSLVGVLEAGDEWYKILYDGEIGYIKKQYLSDDEPGASYEPPNDWPLTYTNDNGTKITVNREWYENAWCYIAHLELAEEDFDNFGTTCAYDTYGSTETTSNCAERIGAILCVNGDYSAPSLNYCVKRSGSVKNNKACTVPGVYNANNGIFCSPEAAGIYGSNPSSFSATDTFCFGPAFLENGNITCSSGGSRAQRTFMGTNGKAGDIYIVVSDGRNNDGESSGLTGYQCAALLKSKGCTFGIPLDGGGSSLMCWRDENGIYQPLNANRLNERAVVDFLYFK